MTTGPDRWDTVERLYHAALARPVGERAAFLAEACADDEGLRRGLESLLAQHATADELLAGGAVAAAAGLVSDTGASTLTGRRLGVYQVLAPLGAGGMGEVYRARDTRLGRDVAIKVLPREFTAHPDRLARFEREARVLASLNHPNIAAIYGVEDAPAEAGAHLHALVLELVEGDTLADRITRGGSKGLSVKEALTIARQIAEALDAAHEKGIIHRDLKPANIKITPDGVVKVLDFGLAKVDVRAWAEAASASPTITVGATGEGLIVGTAAYMSPEQARGLPVDKRTDIWAFGCVLYEMLTARAPFAAKTVSDTLAAILDREPDWDALPPNVPSRVYELMHRSLEKELRQRLRDIGDASVEIARNEDGSHPRTAPAKPRRRVGIATGLVAGAVLGAVVTVMLPRPAPQMSETGATQFAFSAPPGGALEMTAAAPSPDGSRIAFVARQGSSAPVLWIRRRDSAVPQRIAGTEGAAGPIWSPDGRHIAFQSGGKLKRVDPFGGSVLTIASMGANLGSTWSNENTIVFAPSNRTTLFKVSANGGTPEALTTLDASRRENSHRWPMFLPDGRHFLFTARSDVKENTAIYAGSLDGGTATRVLTAQSNAVYAPPGFLLFAREGSLMAQRFDARSLTLSGDAAPVAAGVEQVTASAQGLFSVSADGKVLVFHGAVGRNSRLTWFDDSGTNLGSIAAEKDFTTDLEIAPNGRQAVVVVPDPDSGNRDLWLVDLRGGGLTRLTSHPANDWQPAWEPDSVHVLFASDRSGLSKIYRATTDGSPSDQLVLEMPRNAFPRAASADGRVLIFELDSAAGNTDLWTWLRGGAQKPTPLIESPFYENHPSVSPDGRWFVYESDESGTTEIYLRSLTGEGKQQVSRGGGRIARWKRDGTALFYVSSADQIMRVPVNWRDTPEFGAPVVVFSPCKRGDPNPLYEGRWFDTAPDGRFLMPCGTAHDVPSITVTVGWANQLRDGTQ